MRTAGTRSLCGGTNRHTNHGRGSITGRPTGTPTRSRRRLPLPGGVASHPVGHQGRELRRTRRRSGLAVAMQRPPRGREPLPRRAPARRESACRPRPRPGTRARLRRGARPLALADTPPGPCGAGWPPASRRRRRPRGSPAAPGAGRRPPVDGPGHAAATSEREQRESPPATYQPACLWPHRHRRRLRNRLESSEQLDQVELGEVFVHRAPRPRASPSRRKSWGTVSSPAESGSTGTPSLRSQRSTSARRPRLNSSSDLRTSSEPVSSSAWRRPSDTTIRAGSHDLVGHRIGHAAQHHVVVARQAPEQRLGPRVDPVEVADHQQQVVAVGDPGRGLQGPVEGHRLDGVGLRLQQRLRLGHRAEEAVQRAARTAWAGTRRSARRRTRCRPPGRPAR